jgi:hypothetical protein
MIACQQEAKACGKRPRPSYLPAFPHIHFPNAKCGGVLAIVKGNIEERACQMAQYIVENRATVRAAAQRFGISKSTVHTVVTK